MWPLSSMQKKDVDAVDALLAAGRVNLLDGDTELAPGVTCRLAAESHTFGCQWVEVQTSGGPYVVAGDCVYWYENIEKMWPPAYVQGNTWNLIKVYRAIRAAVNDETVRVVPGHDPELFLRHPVFEAGHHPVAEIHLALGQKSRIAN
jgi:N-acyl homoserine lactone hydrolase